MRIQTISYQGDRKVLATSPIDTPIVGEYAHLLSPGVEARFFVDPVIVAAQESLKNVQIEKRRCYFDGEKVLSHYRHYSKSNCKLECEMNETWAQCQCVDYYMPRLPSEKYCKDKQLPCVNKIRRQLVEHDKCKCYSACYDISYGITKSYGKILPYDFRKQINTPINVTPESTTIVHFFFMKSSYNILTKSELFAFTDIVSNIGGLLGLFMGFSIMSIVEIIYFLSLRLWCNYHKEKNIEKSKNVFYNKDYGTVSVES
ncbi:unnamed protein product [Acanthoscelides obtectus]|uniref:Uncharacterized protein n=1 Tax=Acanthoscelides obtectus TaxID=200917 RepID=A0A9P0NXT9_ACAOB|nr:unnamed protein product [Acanthoscelides obtectus]CAK1631461.1 Pickpocket protein 28 [Acanthoscelides obtectus]